MATAKKGPTKKAVPKPAKKAIARKATPKAEAPTWGSIHIFGYGETQMIGRTHNGKVANAELKAIEPLLAALAEKQQKGTKVNLADTHVLSIFNNSFVDFRPKPSGKNSQQRFAWSDVDAKHISKLAAELIGKMPEQKPRKNFMEILRKNSKPAVIKKSALPADKKTVAMKKKTATKK